MKTAAMLTAAMLQQCFNLERPQFCALVYLGEPYRRFESELAFLAFGQVDGEFPHSVQPMIYEALIASSFVTQWEIFIRTLKCTNKIYVIGAEQ